MMQQTIQEQKIAELITPTVQSMGCDVVILRMNSGTRSTLQIMLEKIDGSNITLDECGVVSREISSLLDVEDSVQGKYLLEVGSAGINRPLTKKADYIKFVGEDIKLETLMMIDNARKFRGVLKEANDDICVIETIDNDEVEISYSNIKKANLDRL